MRVREVVKDFYIIAPSLGNDLEQLGGVRPVPVSSLYGALKTRDRKPNET